MTERESNADPEVSRPREASAPTPPPTTLIFPSSAEYLPLVRNCVRWHCTRRGLGETEGDRVVLAVVEAVTNIIRHAYSGETFHSITLRFREIPEGIELEFLDEGRGASEGELRGRDLDDVRPGGLGVHLMKCCMDSFHYEERPDGGSRLVLTKRCPPEAGAEENGERT